MTLGGERRGKAVLCRGARGRGCGHSRGRVELLIVWRVEVVTIATIAWEATVGHSIEPGHKEIETSDFMAV